CLDRAAEHVTENEQEHRALDRSDDDELRRTDELEERAASDDCRARQQRGLVTGERCGCHHSLRSLCAAGFTALRLFLFFKHLAGQREEDLIELRLTQGHVVKTMFRDSKCFSASRSSSRPP